MMRGVCGHPGLMAKQIMDNTRNARAVNEKPSLWLHAHCVRRIGLQRSYTFMGQSRTNVAALANSSQEAPLVRQGMPRNVGKQTRHVSNRMPPPRRRHYWSALSAREKMRYEQLHPSMRSLPDNHSVYDAYASSILRQKYDTSPPPPPQETPHQHIAARTLQLPCGAAPHFERPICTPNAAPTRPRPNWASRRPKHRGRV
jgi:hypothetical protein